MINILKPSYHRSSTSKDKYIKELINYLQHFQVYPMKLRAYYSYHDFLKASYNFLRFCITIVYRSICLLFISVCRYEYNSTYKVSDKPFLIRCWKVVSTNRARDTLYTAPWVPIAPWRTCLNLVLWKAMACISWTWHRALVTRGLEKIVTKSDKLPFYLI